MVENHSVNATVVATVFGMADCNDLIHNLPEHVRIFDISSAWSTVQDMIVISMPCQHGDHKSYIRVVCKSVTLQPADGWVRDAILDHNHRILNRKGVKKRKEVAGKE